MSKKKFLSYNLYFILPFLTWVIAGGIAILLIGKNTLFLSINTHYSTFGDVLLYYVTWLGQAEVIIPCLLLLMLMPRLRNRWYFFTALACNVIPFLIQHVIKSTLNYPRPLLVLSDGTGRNYVQGLHYLPSWPFLLHSSFPSGHSQGAFSFFCFLSLLLHGRYRWYGFLLFFVALSVCYSRIYLSAHFFEDVYAGSILGTVLTTIIFTVMDRYKGVFFKKKDIFI